MTHAEWLSSDDPSAMLAILGTTGVPTGHADMSDRRLRLFALACYRVVHGDSDLAPAVEAWIEAGMSAPPPDGAWFVCALPAGDAARFTPDQLRRLPFTGKKNHARRMVHHLRCIVGDPWAVVTLPLCKRCDGDGEAHGSDRPFESTGPGTWPGPCPVCKGAKHAFATPQVLLLAESAYEARPGRKCESCKGERRVEKPRKSGYTTQGMLQDCPDCRGTGRIEDGSLDNGTLAVLADALEESGCGPVACPTCSHRRQSARAPGGRGHYACPTCRGDGLVHHPLLAHLRSPGPHVRGCFAIDALTGRS